MLKATFDNIKKQLQELIDESKESIIIAVAWFTSKDLLGQLTEKVEKGCKVEVIISDHFENQRLSFNKFITAGGKVNILPTKSGKFLHDKFVVFDGKTVVVGSYNWTRSAEYYNHEVAILSDDSTLIKQFNAHFNMLKRTVHDYNQKELVGRGELNAESKEQELIQLENELEEKFIQTVKESNKLGAKINATSVIDYIHRFGAVGGATRLINAGTENLQSGLIKLFEIDRLDISFESIILEEKFRILFDKNVLENAEKRLSQLRN